MIKYNDEVLVRAVDGNVELTVSDEKNRCRDIRLSTVFPFFKKAIDQIGNIEFVLNLSDRAEQENQYGLPYLCMTKCAGSDHILIPTVDMFSGLLHDSLKISGDDMDYESKLFRSCFIGSSTGSGDRVDHCNRLVYTPLHIAKISNFCQGSVEEWTKRFPDAKKCFHRGLSIKEQLKNKILVNIDGNVACWSRLYWQMNSNSVPVYINKTNKYEQYFDRFDDKDCYFECDLDGFLDICNYIFDESNIDHTIRVINNGKRFCQEVFGGYINDPVNFLENTVYDILSTI